MQPGNVTSDDFDVAKKVFDVLKDLPADRQERVLRWVQETLNVSVVSRSVVSQTSGYVVREEPVLSPSASPKVTDIKSFVASKQPGNDAQFAAVVAYYYQFEAPESQRQDTINTTVLQEACRLIGRKRLANPRYALNQAKYLGYLNGVARGEFAINTVGENLVAITLPGGVVEPAKKNGRNGSAGSRKPKTKKPARKKSSTGSGK